MRTSTLIVGYALTILSLTGYGTTTTPPVHSAPLPRSETASVLSVSIAGPSEVNPADLCTWYAVVSGGTPPYTYQWNSNGMVDMSGPGLDYWSGYKSFGYSWLTVTVQDAADQGGTNFLIITQLEDQVQHTC